MDCFTNKLNYIANFLKLYNYPNVVDLESNKIVELLSLSNRKHILTWLYRILNESHLENVASNSFLEDFLKAYGFCKNRDIALFLKGSLPKEDEVNIYYNICYFVNDIKSANDIEDHSDLQQKIENLINIDLNIFKDCGDIKTFSQKNEDKVILQTFLTAAESRCDVPLKSKDPIKMLDNIKLTLVNIQNKIPIMYSNILELVKHKHNHANIVEITNEQMLLLKSFNQNFSKYIRFMNSLQQLNAFPENYSKLKIEIENVIDNETIAIMNEMYMLVSEVVIN